MLYQDIGYLTLNFNMDYLDNNQRFQRDYGDIFTNQTTTNLNSTSNIENINNSNEYIITNFYFSLKGRNIMPITDIINIEKKVLKNNDKRNNKRGRKSKGESQKCKNNELKIHNKFSDDNMRKKCKNIIIKCLLEFINKQIKSFYGDDMWIGGVIKELKILEQGDMAKSTVASDKIFLNKNLKDFFSQNISGRFCNYSIDHNKKLIETLINDEDENKKEYFTSLFNLKFSECLKVLRGDIDLKELNGFKSLPLIIEELSVKYDEKYLDHLIYYFNHFEDIILKKPKNKKFEDTQNN